MSSSAEFAISVENVSKKFSRSLRRGMAYGLIDVAKGMLRLKVNRTTLRPTEFFALRSVSFSVAPGEFIGVIGRNGSGKSTLLRLIAGILPIDEGRIAINGRIGALISLGAGFHPHMTGRENIFLNGTILGMSRKEIEARFDEIIEFAEIGEFLDAPVATYSSGMTVRLGFSIAIHSKPEILLADEVLAVGDLPFTLKCYRKISEFRKAGGTVLLVSHSIQQVRNFCTQALWLDHGKTVMIGPAQQVCDDYGSQIHKSEDKRLNQSSSEKSPIIRNDPTATITRVVFINAKEEENGLIRQGERIKIRLYFKCTRTVRKPVFTLSLFDLENIVVVSNYSTFDGFVPDRITGEGFVDWTMENASLKPSQYSCMITFAEEGDVNCVIEWHEKAYSFVVESSGWQSYGIVNAFSKWSLG